MSRITLTLAALGLLALPVAQAEAASGALSYPMAAHVAAQYGVQSSGVNSVIQPVGLFRHGNRSPHGGIVVRPPVFGHPPVIMPGYGHPPVYHHPPVYNHPPVYRYQPYYYPRSGFQYHGRGFSIGIGF
ncbi:MAG TPA: hypothetical protein VMY42_22795 [Thermoguttaceae bacterium]|nr:hypothetical protein [Thermoguttaceae bacterium]